MPHRGPGDSKAYLLLPVTVAKMMTAKEQPPERTAWIQRRGQNWDAKPAVIPVGGGGWG